MAYIDVARANELSWQGALSQRLGILNAPPTVLYSIRDPYDMETKYAARLYLGKENIVTPAFTDIRELLDYTAVVVRMFHASKEN